MLCRRFWLFDGQSRRTTRYTTPWALTERRRAGVQATAPRARFGRDVVIVSWELEEDWRLRLNLLVTVRPRAGGRPRCGRCWTVASGYDRGGRPGSWLRRVATSRSRLCHLRTDRGGSERQLPRPQAFIAMIMLDRAGIGPDLPWCPASLNPALPRFPPGSDATASLPYPRPAMPNVKSTPAERRPTETRSEAQRSGVDATWKACHPTAAGPVKTGRRINPR